MGPRRPATVDAAVDEAVDEGATWRRRMEAPGADGQLANARRGSSPQAQPTGGETAGQHRWSRRWDTGLAGAGQGRRDGHGAGRRGGRGRAELRGALPLQGPSHPSRGAAASGALRDPGSPSTSASGQSGRDRKGEGHPVGAQWGQCTSMGTVPHGSGGTPPFPGSAWPQRVPRGLVSLGRTRALASGASLGRGWLCPQGHLSSGQPLAPPFPPLAKQDGGVCLTPGF